MKKLTRKEKVRIDRQLRKKKYSQGGHTVCIGVGDPVTVIIKGHDAYLPSGSRLPVPEEWWI
jgi:hypothetical protein